MFTSNIVFWSLLVLFAIEQVIYWEMLGYPYGYGIPIKTITLPKLELSWWLSTKHARIYVKKNELSDDLNLRFKHGFGSIAPLLFVGRINASQPDKLRIRVGYFASLLIIWMAVPNKFTFNTFLNALFILITVAVFYYIFVSSINKALANAESASTNNP